jgi:hypothetical protein
MSKTFNARSNDTDKPNKLHELPRPYSPPTLTLLIGTSTRGTTGLRREERRLGTSSTLGTS